MELVVIILSKIRQTQKDRNHVFSYIKNLIFKYENGMGTIWEEGKKKGRGRVNKCKE